MFSICVAWVLVAAGAPSANPGLGEPGGSEASCLELPGTHVTLDRQALAELGLGGLKITSHGTGGTGTYPDDFVGVPISFVIGPAP